MLHTLCNLLPRPFLSVSLTTPACCLPVNISCKVLVAVRHTAPYALLQATNLLTAFCPLVCPVVRVYVCSSFEWDRFMRFMERYAEDMGLGFQKS